LQKCSDFLQRNEIKKRKIGEKTVDDLLIMKYTIQNGADNEVIDYSS